MFLFFFKQKTAYEMRISDWSSDVCSSDLVAFPDTCVGTDSHTPHVDALGVIAIGVGGLEAETVMLGLPSMMRLPDIVGVRLTGKRQPEIGRASCRERVCQYV